MTTIVCQNVGNYEGRGREYVTKLFDGFRRNLTQPVKFVCLTDDPDCVPSYATAKAGPPELTGYWIKMAMLMPGMFEPGEKIVACDLDTIVTGNVDHIVSYDGDFAANSDPYHPERFSSSLMIWRAGFLDHVWTDWNAAGRPKEQFGVFGDGACIEHYHPHADRLQTRFPGQISSYKVDCRKYSRMPPDTRILYFHGRPKCHDCLAPFVKALWSRPLISV